MNIGGVNIRLPNDISNIQGKAGAYGGNIATIAINLLLLGISITSLFFIIWGGIQWISSEGDPKKIEGARNTIIFACIGLAVAFLSFLLVNVLKMFFNFFPTS